MMFAFKAVPAVTQTAGSPAVRRLEKGDAERSSPGSLLSPAPSALPLRQRLEHHLRKYLFAAISRS